ncbi:MAG: hypothetical protein JJE02_01415, partial [Propionibacteriales bacterium]|nr:hypothetical protein [Propionibacteriales bacterium]
IASPQVLYDHPVNIFVAGFIGSPAMNLVHGRLESKDGSLEVQIGDDRLTVDEAVFESRPALKDYVDTDLIIGIRPEDLEDARLVADSAGRILTAPANLVEPMGSDVMAHLTIDARLGVTDKTAGIAKVDNDALTTLSLVARLNPRTQVKIGDRLDVFVDTARLHYFAPDTGAAIWQNDEGSSSDEEQI